MTETRPPLSSKASGYRPDIDGLRSVAVLSVVLYHAGFSVVSGGYVGVDVFFVISGYLITSIIASELDRGSFTILGFYERRIRRIFPALMAMCAVTALAGWWLLMPFDFKAFGQSLLANSLFASNFYFLAKTGYFNQEAELRPLLHTWSLSVEEQYYVFFPLILMAAHRFARRFVREIVAGLCAVSLVAGIVAVRTEAPTAFFLLPYRAWELLIGSLLALGAIPPVESRWLRESIGTAGLLAIAVAVFGFTGETRFPGEAAILPVFGSGAVIHAGSRGRTTALAGLAARPAVFVGLISYSLYLWHWPIIVVYRYLGHGDIAPTAGVLLLIAALAAATLSWWFVERPLRRKEIWTPSNPRIPTHLPLLAAAAGCIAVGVGFGALANSTNGLPTRLPAAVAEAGLVAFDINPHRDCGERSVARIRRGDLCTIGDPTAKPSFVLLGDSFADALAPGLDEAARIAARSGYVVSRGGCGPFQGVNQTISDCRAYVDAALDFIRERPELKTVVMIGRWTTSAEGTRFGVDRHGGMLITDDDSRGSDYAENRAVMRRGLERTLSRLADRRIVFGAYLPEQEVNVPRSEALRLYFGRDGDIGVDRATFDRRQTAVRKIFADLAGKFAFTMLDFSAVMCDDHGCPGAVAGAVRYVDDNHVSRTFATKSKAIFAPVFQ